MVIWNGRIPSSYDVFGIPITVPADDKRRLWRPLLLLKADRRIRRLVLLLQIVSFPHPDHHPRPALRICQDAIVWGGCYWRDQSSSWSPRWELPAAGDRGVTVMVLWYGCGPCWGRPGWGREMLCSSFVIAFIINCTMPACRCQHASIARKKQKTGFTFIIIYLSSFLTKAQSLRDMCEFCSFGPNSSRQNHGEDAFSMGLFSAEAIDQAVRQANEAKQQRKAAAAAESTADDGDGEDDDGT